MSVFYRFKFAFLICLLSRAGSVTAQPAGGPPDTLLLRQERVVLTPVSPTASQAAVPVSPAGENLLIQTAHPFSPEGEAALKTSGIIITGRFGKGIVSVYVSNAALESLRKIAGIRSLQPFKATWKTEPTLAKSGSVKIVILYLPAAAIEVQKAVLAAGGTLLPNPVLPAGMLEATVPAGALASLATVPQIWSIGRASERVPLNSDERGYSGAAALSQPLNAGGKGLDGAGMIVGVGDNTPPFTHIDLAGRTLNFNPLPLTRHGIHVSGTLAGSGILNPAYRGMAPAADLITQSFDGIVFNAPAYRADYGLTLTNNSYAAAVGSCTFSGIYDAYSAGIDRLAETNPDVLHIFAAGNDGRLGCISTPGYGNIPGGYQPAKNNLVVGNVQKDLKIFIGSSKGPILDGRMKPEICAFGTDVYSTFPNNTYAPATGTSMASPSVTGAATLLSQRYRQLKGTNPKGLLLKTLLAGTADDLGNPGPDFSYGLGMFNLSRAVTALEESRYVEGSRTTAGATNYGTLNVPAGLASLKVTLVWTDKPASLAAQQQLIADLDLSLTGPAGEKILPLVLDPQSPAAPAVPGIDKRNNLEQVVVLNPPAGTYAMTVEGPATTAGPVPFSLVWDFVQPGVRLIQPAAGVPVQAGQPLNIYWEAPAAGGSFDLSYSTDSGANWTAVGTVADTNRAFVWNVPAGATRTGMFRVQRGAFTSVQGPFVVNAPPVVTPGAQQCPGYFSFNWNAVTGATAYQVLQLKGRELVAVDTVATTDYFLSGLPLTQEQYVAVAPLINGRAGYRSTAISRMPNTGNNCGAMAANDLLIRALGNTTITGRVATSTALSATESLAVQVQNLGNTAVNSFVVRYRIAGGGWTQTTPQPALAGGTTTTVALAQRDFSATGTYLLEAAVLNTAAADPVAGNDSLQLQYRQLPNAPVALAPGFTEAFETPDRVMLTGDSAGLFSGLRWDYARSGEPFGRVRNFVEAGIVIGGSRSLSLDADRSNAGARNEVTGTFNLITASLANDEIRMEGDYILHGKSKNRGNTGIRLRGSDGAGWLPVFRPDTLRTGEVHNTGSVSLSDALLAGGQALSSSTGVQIVQEDTTTISTISYGRGFTVDNLKLYTVQNDVALLRIDTPLNVACNLSNSVPLRVVVANGMRQAQSNIPLYFRLDSGAVQTAVLAQLQPKDTVVFTFPQTLAAGGPGEHRLDVWLANAGDSYRKNDSLLDFRFRNQPLIDSFPYLENFEAGRGNWYTDKTGSSWAWGLPESRGINRAASGTKAWKTGLQTGYADNEESYLYSPCFDISRLNTPTLSISLAYDIENCGSAVCDEAYAEWSTNGTKWYRLGLSVEGYNWYDSLQHRAWTTEGKVNWRVATTPLPFVQETIRFRFVMKSDGGATREGIAVDDIHIYDKGLPVYTGDFARINKAVAAGDTTVFTRDDHVFAQLSGSSNALGNVEVQSFRHPLFVDDFTSQLFLPQSFTVKAETPVADSVQVAFYVSDEVVQQMAPFPEVPEIAKAPDAYRLGVLRFDALDKAKEDNSLANNTQGLYQYRQPADVVWVPYDSGYIARFPVQGFSEFWFAPTGPTVVFPPADAALQLQVRRQSRDVAVLSFTSFVDSNVNVYEVERAIAGKRDFEKVVTLPARHEGGGVRYNLEDQPPAADNDTVVYRVRWRLIDGTGFRSAPKSVLWTPEFQISLFPNPVTGGALNIRYTASPGSKLELQLTDIMGRLLLKSGETAQAYDNLYTLPVALPAGIYILKGSLGGKNFTEKVLSR